MSGRRLWIGATAAAFALLAAAGAFARVDVRLTDRVLRANELAGFQPARVDNVKDIEAWRKIAPEALVGLEERLRREGFVAAVREDLDGRPADRGALSIVVQLGSRKAALSELAHQLRDYATEASRLAGHTYTPFRVPSIPGARGFSSTDPSGGNGINVIFADGPFTYHVGAGWAHGASDPPTKSAVIRAAGRLYARVHGR